VTYPNRPLGKNCTATGEPFAPGAVCYSVLRTVGGELRRDDFSAEAWNDRTIGDGSDEDILGWWRTRVPDAANGPRPLDPDELIRTLEQLDEEANPSSERLRYVIALQLLNKRRVELESLRSEDELTYLTLVGKRSEGPFSVRDFGLPDEEIEAILDEFRRAG